MDTVGTHWRHTNTMSGWWKIGTNHVRSQVFQQCGRRCFHTWSIASSFDRKCGRSLWNQVSPLTCQATRKLSLFTLLNGRNWMVSVFIHWGSFLASMAAAALLRSVPAIFALRQLIVSGIGSLQMQGQGLNSTSTWTAILYQPTTVTNS